MAKKATGKKATAGKKATDRTLVAITKRVGRTLGRAVNGIDKVKAAARKAVTAKRGKKKTKKDPVVEARRAKDRAAWKSQADEAASRELSKHGTLVDERARVRATASTRWANRKPR